MTAVRSVTGEVTCSKRSAPATSLVVAVEGSGRRTAGEVEVVEPVAVAVERGDAAADEELVLALVGVVDARGDRVVDEPRSFAGVGCR